MSNDFNIRKFLKYYVKDVDFYHSQSRVVVPNVKTD